MVFADASSGSASGGSTANWTSVIETVPHVAHATPHVITTVSSVSGPVGSIDVLPVPHPTRGFRRKGSDTAQQPSGHGSLYPR